MTIHSKTFQYGSETVTLQTGEIARQASAAIVASMGDTVVLVTVVGRKEANPGQSFFPLTINYQEKLMRRARSRVASSNAKVDPANQKRLSVD